MAEAIESILKRLGMWLRFVAPGFVALLVLAVLMPGLQPPGTELFGKPVTAMLLLGSLLGVTIYAVHVNTIAQLLWIAIVAIIKSKCCNKRIPKAYRDKKLFDALYELDQHCHSVLIYIAMCVGDTPDNPLRDNFLGWDLGFAAGDPICHRSHHMPVRTAMSG